MTRFSLLILLILNVMAVTADTPDSLRVALVTCAPGQDIYELEGHSALHISGSYAGKPINVAVNWGVFDFNSPNFVYRFVKGETDYLCAMTDWSYFVAPYMRQGREVVEHPLNLDSIQANRLLALVGENLLPQNRVYRYNYVLDNCATRPLRLVELAMGDSIILPDAKECAGETTFRKVMAYHHRNYPWYQFGIDLALGSGIDRPISLREKSFAPTLLRQQLDSAVVDGRKLTADPIVILPNMGEVSLGPTPWYLTPKAVAWCLFFLTMIVTVRDVLRRKVTRWFDALLYTIYGVAGLVIAFLVFVSVHEATSPNWLILWLNPLCLIVPIFIWLKKCKNVVISYQFINFALILLMVVAWPLTGQCGNMAFVPLIGCDLMRAASYLYITKLHK